MKERPILFSGAMVRAILGGRKTQTRRVIKPQPPSVEGLVEMWHALIEPGMWEHSLCHESDAGLYGDIVTEIRCPYGQPGDELWVRETWWRGSDGIAYRADGEAPAHMGHCWKPSIHMRRADSRIQLRVTEVRVERVQDITSGGEMVASDVVHEGCPKELWTCYKHDYGAAEQAWWESAWDSINAKRGYGWDVNPWVWVVTFAKISLDNPAGL